MAAPELRHSREEVLDLAERYVCPNRVRTLRALGVDLVLGRREGYRLWDVDGRELLDLHLNGGVFNLGHRNPELVAVLVDALETLDIGNHHFPSVERSLLAEQLVGPTHRRRATPSSRAAAARRSTSRSRAPAAPPAAARVVSVTGAYHGHTGLALAAGDERAADVLPQRRCARRVRPRALRRPRGARARAGRRRRRRGDPRDDPGHRRASPSPSRGYLLGVRDLCDASGTLYVADEVQTGLGRTGACGRWTRFGVVPDVLVTRQGPVGRPLPDRRDAARPSVPAAGCEEDGWAPRVHVRRRRARLPGGARRARRDACAEHAAAVASRSSPRFGRRTRRAAAQAPRLAARGAPDRARHRAALRPPAGRHADDEGPVRRRASGRCSPASTPRCCSSSPACSWTTRTADEALDAARPGGLRRCRSRSRAHERRSPPSTSGSSAIRAQRSTRPARRAAGDVEVLGYGEVSVALRLAALPGLVCKRMSGFADESDAAPLRRPGEDRTWRLPTPGVRVVDTAAVPVHSPGASAPGGLPAAAAARLGRQPRPPHPARRRRRKCRPGDRGCAGRRAPAREARTSAHATAARSPSTASCRTGPTGGRRRPVRRSRVLIDVGTPFIRRDGPPR